MKNGPSESATERKQRDPRPYERKKPCPAQLPAPSMVLLAEDDEPMRELLARAFRREGYEVYEVEDGGGLLSCIASGKGPTRPFGDPDVIVTDIRMPGRSGLDVLRTLRRSDWATPVVLITAFGDAATHAEAKRLGATVVLDKPFDLNELVRVVRQIVPAWI